MSTYNYKSGLGSVGQYQISCRPFLTGGNIYGTLTNNGEVKISFPNVTKSVTVINRSSEPILVHFDTRTNSNVYNNHHYMELPNLDDSYGFDIRTTFIYISNLNASGTGSFDLHAELTSIDAEEMHILSGSGINS